MSHFNRQVGGTHYKGYQIEPYEFLMRNKIPHHKAAIIRRILRYDHETGKGEEDLDKIKHEIDLIRELEYKQGTPLPPKYELDKDPSELDYNFCTIKPMLGKLEIVKYCPRCETDKVFSPGEGILKTNSVGHPKCWHCGKYLSYYIKSEE